MGGLDFIFHSNREAELKLNEELLPVEQRASIEMWITKLDETKEESHPLIVCQSHCTPAFLSPPQMLTRFVICDGDDGDNENGMP